MSYVAQRMVYEPRLRRMTRRLPAGAELVPALVVAGIGLVLVKGWWVEVQKISVPLSRGLLDLPLNEFVYQMPGLVVLGLLVVRAAALTGPRTLATQHLAEMASRWGWVWAGSSLVCLALTASQLTGVPVAALAAREDLLAVLGRSAEARAQIATVWVALVIAFFATRLTSTLESRSLVVLAGASLLPVLGSVPGAGHDPGSEHAGTDLHWLAMATLAVQLLAAVVWLGALVALILHLRRFPLHLTRALGWFSRTASCCVLLVGSTALVQHALTLPTPAAAWQTTDGQIVIAKAIALLLLVAVGYRHRRRTVGAGSGGQLMSLAPLAGGELVLMGAVVAITMVITPVL